MKKSFFSKVKTKLSITALSIVTYVFSFPVFASAEDQITAHSASDVSRQIFKANSGMSAAFGGSLIGISVVCIAIKMLITNKRQDARAEGMDSILTIIFAACLIGGFAIFAGLFLGFGQ